MCVYVLYVYSVLVLLSFSSSSESESETEGDRGAGRRHFVPSDAKLLQLILIIIGQESNYERWIFGEIIYRDRWFSIFKGENLVRNLYILKL